MLKKAEVGEFYIYFQLVFVLKFLLLERWAGKKRKNLFILAIQLQTTVVSMPPTIRMGGGSPKTLFVLLAIDFRKIYETELKIFKKLSLTSSIPNFFELIAYLLLKIDIF